MSNLESETQGVVTACNCCIRGYPLQDARPLVTGPGLRNVAPDPRLPVNLTRPGAIMGTAPYMSPEQVRREAVGTRTDIFSFGAVLYEMATGHPAFAGETIGQIQEAILTHEPASPGKLNPRVPGALKQVITKALKKKPEELSMHLRTACRFDPRAKAIGRLWQRRARVASAAPQGGMYAVVAKKLANILRASGSSTRL